MLEIIDKNYTNTVFYEEEVTERKDIYSILAKFAFLMVIFFNFFGTSLPFRDRVFNVHEIGTSNVINQVVFTTMFLVAVVALIPKLRQLNAFVIKEKYMFLFITWCALSVLWSDYPFTSFKRWFQVFAVITAITAALFYLKTDDHYMKYLKPVSALFVLASLISIFTIPGALDEYGVWKGMAASKNHLGQAALVSALIWVFAFKNASFSGKIFAFFMVAVSLVLLFGSESSTAMFGFFIAVLTGSLFIIDNQFKKINAGRLFSFITLISILAFVVYSFVFTPELVNSFLGNFGEDITFTGRTWLWEDILNEASKHLWMGAGFQGFWVITSDSILRLYQVYTWLPNQAHNGYVDIINEVGIIGTAIFLLMIISFFRNAIKVPHKQIWTWFVLVVLLINLQEATLFRGGILTGTMFIFSYLVIMMRKYDFDSELIEQEEEEDA